MRLTVSNSGKAVEVEEENVLMKMNAWQDAKGGQLIQCSLGDAWYDPHDFEQVLKHQHELAGTKRD